MAECEMGSMMGWMMALGALAWVLLLGLLVTIVVLLVRLPDRLRSRDRNMPTSSQPTRSP